MASTRIAPGVLDDFDRIAAHLAKHGVADASSRLAAIISTLGILTDNPLVGRRYRDELWELVIGRGARGYVTCYRYLPVLDVVMILDIRAQREAGYVCID